MRCSIKKADSRQKKKRRTKGEETPISVMAKLERDKGQERERLDGDIYVQIEERGCVTVNGTNNENRRTIVFSILLHEQNL